MFKVQKFKGLRLNTENKKSLLVCKLGGFSLLSTNTFLVVCNKFVIVTEKIK